MRAIG
jgi:hypothetical protein